MLRIQRSVIVTILASVAVISAFAGCFDGNSDSRPEAPAGLDVQSSTIERFTPNSDMVELYTPGAQEIIRYNQTSDQTSSVPADPDLVKQFYQTISNVNGPGPNFFVNCSSRDGTQDCFCGADPCCRTQTQCNCC
jgi:hypothetical protein